MTEYRVIKRRIPELSNPIKLRKGDTVICLEESNTDGDWAGWVLCKGADATGWVPMQMIERTGTEGIVVEDYNAVEFDIEVGEIIVSHRILNGWIWGHKENNLNSEAWAPLNHLEILKSM